MKPASNLIAAAPAAYGGSEPGRETDPAAESASICDDAHYADAEQSHAISQTTFEGYAISQQGTSVSAIQYYDLAWSELQNFIGAERCYSFHIGITIVNNKVVLSKTPHSNVATTYSVPLFLGIKLKYAGVTDIKFTIAQTPDPNSPGNYMDDIIFKILQGSTVPAYYDMSQDPK